MEQALMSEVDPHVALLLRNGHGRAAQSCADAVL